MSAHIQTPKVTSALVQLGSSSGDLMDIEGLVNQALSELVATYNTEAQMLLDPQASGPSLQILETEGPVRGVNQAM